MKWTRNDKTSFFREKKIITLYVKSTQNMLENNKLMQIALVFLAFWVIMQMVGKQTSSEHLDNVDTLVTVQPKLAAPASVNVEQSPLSQASVSVQSTSPSQTLINVQTPSSMVSSPAPVNSLITPELASVSSTASAKPVVTSAPSAAITGTGAVPQPLTSVEEEVVAAAPKMTAPQTTSSVALNQNLFAPEPSDLDALFARGRTQLDPSELIPKVQEAEIYGNIVPDPKFDSKFLSNRFSMGIESKTSGQAINDLRGVPSNIPPLQNLSPWNMPTQIMDVHRRSLCDVS